MPPDREIRPEDAEPSEETPPGVEGPPAPFTPAPDAEPIEPVVDDEDD